MPRNKRRASDNVRQKWTNVWPEYVPLGRNGPLKNAAKQGISSFLVRALLVCWPLWRSPQQITPSFPVKFPSFPVIPCHLPSTSRHSPSTSCLVFQVIPPSTSYHIPSTRLSPSFPVIPHHFRLFPVMLKYFPPLLLICLHFLPFSVNLS